MVYRETTPTTILHIGEVNNFEMLNVNKIRIYFEWCGGKWLQERPKIGVKQNTYIY